MNESQNKQQFVNPELSVSELAHALYETTKKLDETNQSLQKAQKEKDELFANLSHDLRSPVTAIENSVEYLLSLDTIDVQTLYKTLHMIKKRSLFLHQLIEDIFLLTSIDTNICTFHLETIPAGIFLEDFFYYYEADKSYKHRHLNLNVPLDFNYPIKIDCKLFHRALDNLFSNALKYTKNGDSISLQAKAIGNDIQICVSDSGKGISPEDIEKIFDRTYMVSDARTPKKQGGCGLGLAITSSILYSMDGKIRCESKENEGSTFIVTLPIAK